VYTIKQAAARTGLAIPTIRAWERRYGVIRPARTAAGYRLYDDSAIGRLLAMRQLIEIEGWRPSQAAERIAAGGPVVEELARAASRGRDGSADASPDLVERFVAGTRSLDVPAMDRVLDEAFAAERFEEAVEHVVFPALRAIGEGWSNGRIDVAMEHAASETVRRRLAHFFDAARRTERPVRVIVGMPPDGHHELGAFAFAVAARRRGLDVLYLGADVPLASWVTAVEETRARVVVIGAVTATDAVSARRVIEGMPDGSATPRLFVGGAAAGRLAAPGGDVVVLPERLDEAVSVVAALLG
jgi:methanogenic corrinoid protein MtbC1